MPRSIAVLLRSAGGVVLILLGANFGLWALTTLSNAAGEWAAFGSMMATGVLAVLVIPNFLLAFGLFAGGARCAISSGIICILAVVAGLAIVRDPQDPYWFVVIGAYSFAAIASFATVHVRDKPGALHAA